MKQIILLIIIINMKFSACYPNEGAEGGSGAPQTLYTLQLRRGRRADALSGNHATTNQLQEFEVQT